MVSWRVCRISCKPPHHHHHLPLHYLFNSLLIFWQIMRIPAILQVCLVITVPTVSCHRLFTSTAPIVRRCEWSKWIPSVSLPRRPLAILFRYSMPLPHGCRWCRRCKFHAEMQRTTPMGVYKKIIKKNLLQVSIQLRWKVHILIVTIVTVKRIIVDKLVAMCMTVLITYSWLIRTTTITRRQNLREVEVVIVNNHNILSSPKMAW